jgi:phage major head subunit gpT-like protein
MNPTNELRFVRKAVENLGNGNWRMAHVLQQKWATPYISRADQYGRVQYSFGEPTEWRDVPLVEEEK